VWNRSGEHGRLGSLRAVSVLCVFGPSLFGYNTINMLNWFKMLKIVHYMQGDRLKIHATLKHNAF